MKSPEAKKNEPCLVVNITFFTKLLFKMDFWFFLLLSDDPQFLVYFDCHTLQQQCMYPVCLFLYHQHCCISNSQLHLPSFLLTFPSEATGWNINTWIIKSTQYKKLAQNALRFKYQNLKSCKQHEKTKQKPFSVYFLLFPYPKNFSHFFSSHWKKQEQTKK